LPSRNRQTSVVVPPMSETRASLSPVSQLAPAIEAAGPDRIVSIGRSRARPADTSAPSPRTTIRGAAMPSRAMCASQAVISPSIIPMRRALRTAVSARRGPFSPADSS
jgi:hypothetical protein